MLHRKLNSGLSQCDFKFKNHIRAGLQVWILIGVVLVVGVEGVVFVSFTLLCRQSPSVLLDFPPGEVPLQVVSCSQCPEGHENRGLNLPGSQQSSQRNSQNYCSIYLSEFLFYLYLGPVCFLLHSSMHVKDFITNILYPAFLHIFTARSDTWTPKL